MKKIPVIFLFSITILLTVNVTSCDPCGVGSIYFQTGAISASSLQITGIDTSGCCNTYITSPYQPNSTGIRYDSLLLMVENDIHTAFNETPVNYRFWINSAMACSPSKDYDVFKEVNITSNQPYSSLYPAGSLLNDIISVSEDARVLDSKIDNIMINFSNRASRYFFKFNIPPDSIRVHTITIEYIFTDNRVVRSEINDLKINN